MNDMNDVKIEVKVRRKGESEWTDGQIIKIEKIEYKKDSRPICTIITERSELRLLLPGSDEWIKELARNCEKEIVVDSYYENEVKFGKDEWNTFRKIIFKLFGIL